jgi:cytoskeletal protein RodZ
MTAMTKIKTWMWAVVLVVLGAVLAVVNPSFLSATETGGTTPKPAVTAPKPAVKKPKPATTTPPAPKPDKKKPTAASPIPPTPPDEGC